MKLLSVAVPCYNFQPLPFVRNMYYPDVNFYRYYIGRESEEEAGTMGIYLRRKT